MFCYAPFPPPDKSNPFQLLLATGLRAQGWEACVFNFKPGPLLSHRGKVTWLHFHWPESIWRSKNLPAALLRALRFAGLVLGAKALGYRVCWSAHNALPHESRSWWLERTMRRFLLTQCDLVVGHAANTRQELSTLFGSSGAHYIEALHGLYLGHYHGARPSEAVREELGIPKGVPVFFSLASRKAYKGTAGLLAAWTKLQHPAARLILAGDVPDECVATCRAPSVIRRPGFLAEQELAELITAACAVIMPYEHITTSGTFFLALTLRRPVIAPALPFFAAHARGRLGWLYGPTASHANLSAAICAAIKDGAPDDQYFDEPMGLYDWNVAAEKIARHWAKSLT